MWDSNILQVQFPQGSEVGCLSDTIKLRGLRKAFDTAAHGNIECSSRYNGLRVVETQKMIFWNENEIGNPQPSPNENFCIFYGCSSQTKW